MTEPGGTRLGLLVRRLSLRARVRRALTEGTGGLFIGLLGALIIAAAAGSVSVPRPALIASLAAAAGAAIGACLGFLARVDARLLLIHADRLLGSRELMSTGHELAVTGTGGTFADAVIQDAAGLLSRTGARRALGPLRPPLAPWLPVVAALVAAALLFPVDLRSLLRARPDRDAELAVIGEDLRGLGERLQEASRAQDLGRRLALSEELAQLGGELADHRITSDEALDRISDLENRVAREYQLQMQAPAAGPLPGGSGSGGSSQGSSSAPGKPGAGSGNPADSTDSSGSSGADSQDLAGALDRLREAQKLLQNGDKAASRPPSSSGGQNSANSDRAGQGSAGNQGSGQSGLDGANLDDGGGGPGGDSDAPAGQSQPGGAPGNVPAPVKTGLPTSIASGTQGSLQRAQGTLGEGDSTSFLVRALPDWTGSKLPEDAVRRQYAQAAETALLRDEVPPKLKASVRDYFTNIGIPAGGTTPPAAEGTGQ